MDYQDLPILPIGRQNFEMVREEKMLYVDKTQYVHRLVTRLSQCFLSRPRRFGKTLLVNLLKVLFQGKKHLFEDLWIYDHWEWEKTYPVLHLNMANLKYTQGNMPKALQRYLNRLAKEHSIIFGDNATEPGEKLFALIKGLSIANENKPVVLLLDEYDKPVLHALHTPWAIPYRDVLKDFYEVIKTLEAEGLIRFLFITGVSKFAKMSIFSALNNLTDITLREDFAALVGITQIELEQYFAPFIEVAQKKFNHSRQEILERIKRMYNGYSWDAKTFVYNPYSLLLFFDALDFKYFWYATGTPTFLVRQIRNTQINPADVYHQKVEESFFEASNIKDLDPLVVLYQAGYLTIKNTSQLGAHFKFYHLEFPNLEVEHAFMRNLLEEYAFKKDQEVSQLILGLHAALHSKNVADIVQILKQVFAELNYQLHPTKRGKTPEQQFEVWEGYFQSVIYLVFRLLGYYMQCEVLTNKGRIDSLIETDKYIYLIEFKMGDAASGMAQIQEKGYYEKYHIVGKTMILLAIGFDKTERNIKDWLVEEK